MEWGPIHFATALEQTVNVVVYGEFEAVLEIDKGRNIIYEINLRSAKPDIPTIFAYIKACLVGDVMTVESCW